MKTLKQSTAYNLMVLMIDSTDHIAGKAGLTLTITASKNGAAFASITPTVTDRGSGWYNLALTTSHTDTVGDLAVHITATGADPVDISMQVLTKSIDDLATATALQTVDDFVDDLETRLSAARAGYLDKLNVTGTLAHSDAAATYKADVSSLATSSALSAVSAFVDTEVAAILAAVDTEVAAIKAKTDQLIFTVANKVDASAAVDAASIRSAVGLASANLDTQLGTIDSNVDAVLVDTGTTLDGKINVVDDLVDDLETRLTATRAGYLDRLDAAVSSRMATFTYSAPPSAADIATAVWGATTRTLSSFGSLIADVWGYATRTLSAFGFTVATNSDANVTAIKAKTDNLPASPAAVGSAMTLTAAYDKAKDDVLTPLAVADSIVDAIKLKTDLIPAFPAVADEYDAALAAIQADLDNPNQYKADVSGLATSVNLATVDSVVDAIKLKTDNLPALPASEATVNTRLAASAYTAPPTVSDIVTGVWGATTRTLSSFGTLIADIWGYATRTLSAFGFTVTASPDSNVALIKAKTDNLPASPAAVGSAMTLTSGERTAIANEVEAQIINEADAERVLTAITDKIASVNPSLDDLTLAGIASAVRTELATELARIDAAISSRLASAGYTAPDNASITAIKAKTDNLPANTASALSAIQADLDNPNQYKADVSSLATGANLSLVKDAADAIKLKTDLLPADPASQSVVESAIEDIPVAPTAEEIREEIDANSVALSGIGTIADKLDTMLEVDNDAYRFTENALENAPTAGDIGALVEAMEDLPANIYDELSRIVSVSLALPTAGEIVVYAGDSVDFQISGLGDLRDATKIYFCAKLRKTDPDTSSIVLIEKTAGLLRINAAAGTPANGSVTVLDAVAGNIRVKLAPSESVKIPEATYFCDVKIINELGEAVTKTQGEILFYYDITKAVS